LLPSLLPLPASFFKVLLLPLPQKFNRFHIPARFMKNASAFGFLKSQILTSSHPLPASFFKVFGFHKNLTASASLGSTTPITPFQQKRTKLQIPALFCQKSLMIS